MLRVVLEIIDGPMAGYRSRVPESAPLRVGRARQSDLALTHDRTMSGTHFVVEIRAGRCRVRDLQSLNGTFLNEAAIDHVQPVPRTRIRAGNTTFLVRFEGT